MSLPDLVGHPQVSFDIVLTHEEELWQKTGRRAWRRKGWCVVGRRLVEVLRVVPFADATDFAALLPAELAEPFTTRDLADRRRSAARPRLQDDLLPPPHGRHRGDRKAEARGAVRVNKSPLFDARRGGAGGCATPSAAP